VRQHLTVPLGHPRIDKEETTDIVAALRATLEAEAQERVS
jgi:hypothetical protein